jgi:hypothetical protein
MNFTDFMLLKAAFIVICALIAGIYMGFKGR